ncbi:DUF599 domain-containing protein [Chelatococcus reniformis]|uniref:Membrane protein n=1 Tax=Chelatococcus reniformis TaxID=1494448 RepID=A0A916U235_9HYPH|nr:DUF599 family protein [Chelatococcus reniformis]GGC57807.1 membrane protein [Chelatococcus reniformis]
MNPFSVADYIAVAFFAAAWGGYTLAVERWRGAHRSLNMRMNGFRLVWMERMWEREQRIVDASIMAALQNGTAFFASTALLAMGGSLALLRSTDDVLRLIADLPFAVMTSRLGWEIKVVGLVIIFGYAFFKFAWSYRLFNYAAILIGAMPPPQERREGALHVRRCAAMHVAAGRHFNRGQRAFFFALAYLGWFVSAYVMIAATALVLRAMWRRQFSSEGRAALELTSPAEAGGDAAAEKGP